MSDQLSAWANAQSDDEPGRLRAAMVRAQRPMLICDDHRRWVTGNRAAHELLGLTEEAISWHTMDDFTPPDERDRLQQQWKTFLASGAAAGRYELYVPQRGRVPVEFGAIANVLPSRHLAVFMPDDDGSAQATHAVGDAAWAAVARQNTSQAALTRREREVMTMLATGTSTAEIAQRLFVSAETVKSHVQNAMGKLGAHTRAHAVAIALVTGQIS